MQERPLEGEASVEVKEEKGSEATAERPDAGEAVFEPRSSCTREPRVVAQPCLTHPESHEFGVQHYAAGKTDQGNHLRLGCCHTAVIKGSLRLVLCFFLRL